MKASNLFIHLFLFQFSLLKSNKLFLALLLSFCVLQPQILFSQILMQESSVEYKEAEKLVPIYKSNEGFIDPPRTVKKQYNMLQEIDVYTLSPYAKLLLMNHMVDVRIYKDLASSEIDWDSIASLASKKHGLQKELILAVIQTESNFIADATSRVGAQGAMQIMPQTAKELGLEDPFNASENVDAGTRYLKAQIERFQDIELALAAYNAGPGNVIKYNGIPPFEETQNFVKKVLSHL